MLWGYGWGMVSVIRDTHEDFQPVKMRALSKIVITFLVLFVLACVAFAVWQSRILGWPAFIFIAGLGFAALFGLFAILAAGKAEMPDVFVDDETGPFIQAFLHSPDAALLMRGGKPWKANRQYMDLAVRLDSMGISKTPPTIDRLFQASEKETASAIFRLHHLRGDRSQAEEFIDTLTPQGQLRRYHIQVAGLGDSQLWQINDVTEAHGSVDATLVGAPVGLMSVNEEGQIVATNRVLNRWLGIEHSVRPDFMREVVEDIAPIMEAPRVSGRIIRADTRLVTQKGIVTPTIMTGTWNELDSGEKIASIAFYGHSSFGAPPAALIPAKGEQSGQTMIGQSSQAANDVGSGGFDRGPLPLVQVYGEDLKTAKIISANHAFEALCPGLFWRDIGFLELFTASSRDTVLRHIGQLATGAITAILAKDEKTPVRVYGVRDPSNPHGLWINLVENSAHKDLEDQLAQSQKMQAIGQLAAGVAHDFNNLLTTIRLNTDELMGRHPVGDPSYKELHAINNTVNRAAGLVKKLLAFSRKQTLRMEPLNLTNELSDLTSTLRQSLGERVSLNVIHGRGLPPIKADKTQLDQVLLNLCVNARDAMEDQGGGKITITTSEVKRDAIRHGLLTETSGERFVLMAFSDTGTGMTDAVKEKIFEPFFTTKEQGKGTGLGLATVYGIIQQTGGILDVESELGVGTTFRIFLPVANPDDTARREEIAATPAKTEQPKPRDLAGQGTILFVEDEVSVRTIAAKTLRKRGYTVIEAGDGEEAYEILEDDDHTFDLMISDVVMPAMDGPTLLKKGRDMLGDARIVFISGYAEEEFSDLLSEEPDVTFLPKPFTLAQLAEKVKAEIGEML